MIETESIAMKKLSKISNTQTLRYSWKKNFITLRPNNVKREFNKNLFKILRKISRKELRLMINLITSSNLCKITKNFRFMAIQSYQNYTLEHNPHKKLIQDKKK